MIEKKKTIRLLEMFFNFQAEYIFSPREDKQRRALVVSGIYHQKIWSEFPQFPTS
jgi:hypothetical protein